MAIKIYNKLPDGLKSEKSILVFQKRLKIYLIKECFYSVTEYLESKIK